MRPVATWHRKWRWWLLVRVLAGREVGVGSCGSNGWLFFLQLPAFPLLFSD